MQSEKQILNQKREAQKTFDLFLSRRRQTWWRIIGRNKIRYSNYHTNETKYLQILDMTFIQPNTYFRSTTNCYSRCFQVFNSNRISTWTVHLSPRKQFSSTLHFRTFSSLSDSLSTSLFSTHCHYLGVPQIWFESLSNKTNECTRRVENKNRSESVASVMEPNSTWKTRKRNRIEFSVFMFHFSSTLFSTIMIVEFSVGNNSIAMRNIVVTH